MLIKNQNEEINIENIANLSASSTCIHFVYSSFILLAYASAFQVFYWPQWGFAFW